MNMDIDREELQKYLGKNYYGTEGCCIACPEEIKVLYRQDDGKCLCPDCKCRECIHYVALPNGTGRCDISLKREAAWEDVWIEVDGIIHETEKSMLIRDGNRKVWLPKSLTEVEEREERVFDDTLSYWLGEEKKVLYVKIPAWLADIKFPDGE